MQEMKKKLSPRFRLSHLHAIIYVILKGSMYETLSYLLLGVFWLSAGL